MTCRRLDAASCGYVPDRGGLLLHLQRRASCECFWLTSLLGWPHSIGAFLLVRASLHAAVGGFDPGVQVAKDQDYVRAGWPMQPLRLPSASRCGAARFLGGWAAVALQHRVPPAKHPASGWAPERTGGLCPVPPPASGRTQSGHDPREPHLALETREPGDQVDSEPEREAGNRHPLPEADRASIGHDVDRVTRWSRIVSSMRSPTRSAVIALQPDILSRLHPLAVRPHPCKFDAATTAMSRPSAIRRIRSRSRSLCPRPWGAPSSNSIAAPPRHRQGNR